MKKIFRYIKIELLIFIVLYILSCESRKNSDESVADNTQNQEIFTSEKTGSANTSGSFKEFVNKKNEIDLILYPARDNGFYDPKEMIDLSVEMYNPRHLAFHNYKNDLGPDSADFTFKNVFIGSEQQSWTEYLTLSVLDGPGNNNDNVLFSTTQAGRMEKLNIGKGDIGVCKLLIQPGYFSKSGILKFNLTFHDPVADKKLNAETTITLQDDWANRRLQNISEIKYLLATKERQKALDLAIKTVNEWPESYNARILLGSVYEENDQVDKALQAYRRSLGLFKSEEQGQLTEAPIGLYEKIKELEEKLK